MLNQVATKGRVKILKALLYKSHMVYVRRIGEDYFEYLLEYKGEIYSGYNIISPRPNRKKISPKDVGMLSDLLLAMAQTTLDALLGEPVDEKGKETLKLIEGNNKNAKR